MGKAFKTASSEIKNKTNMVMQELREAKRLRGDGCSSLMSQIEMARARFEGQVSSERKKRA